VSHLPNRVKTDPGASGDRHGSRQGERDVDQFAAGICPPRPLWALAADPDDKTAIIFEDWEGSPASYPPRTNWLRLRFTTTITAVSRYMQHLRMAEEYSARLYIPAAQCGILTRERISARSTFTHSGAQEGLQMQLRPRSWSCLIWDLWSIFVMGATATACTGDPADGVVYPPLCIDSSSPEALESGKPLCFADGGMFSLPREFRVQVVPPAAIIALPRIDLWLVTHQLSPMHESPSLSIPHRVELTQHSAAKKLVNKLTGCIEPGAFSRLKTGARKC
jgi:hypothetical protein